jgi:hypothetical protein
MQCTELILGANQRLAALATATEITSIHLDIPLSSESGARWRADTR